MTHDVDPLRWEPEHLGEGGWPWCPTLWGNGFAFSLPVWFRTKQACAAFIARIPAGSAT